jgi:hypothetical protein
LKNKAAQIARIGGMASVAIARHRLIPAWWKLRGLWLICLTGVADGSRRSMTSRRFVFSFPGLNLYEVIWAISAVEARHRLMNSNLAPYYGQAVLLYP